ncbi:MAG: hypothetical protein QN141_00815 [Armatimonadota bacterium]|nr:hypothetical protein [Armatimonadota bacterium]MDR7450877.1 hypothetical protein [Armatimonadota bacterium]MDR7465799.1 hypothetical protein [Armatimonadota bacterium]MDR7493707.1 hypothetical protein [Armatimonadota bacterium]MDR7500571.1 hypothetical protein [Armatimonadota bacterium]
MRRRTLQVLLAGAVVAVLVVGGVVYGRLRSRPAAARGDPAVLAALAIMALERSGDRALSSAQVAVVLPLLRVLRDTDPEDVEASRALVRQILDALTPEQRREIRRLQQQRRRRQEGGAGQDPGVLRGRRESGPVGSVAPGGPAGGLSRAEIRRRVLDRVIARLEQRR